MRADNIGIAGAFEELPTLMVVLVAVSLFSVSVAHAVLSFDSTEDYSGLREDCLTFSGMVRASETLSDDGKPGVFSHNKLQNLTGEDFLREFNATSLGIGYRVSVQCLDTGTGNIILDWTVQSADIPKSLDLATFSSCIGVDNNGIREAARLTVTIWRVDA